MVEIKNVQVFGFDRAINASKNPMTVGDIDTEKEISSDDIKSRIKLASVNPGTGHDCFLSGITVYFDIKYPEYWSAEFQRYHFAQIISSQSKMHKLIKAAGSSDFDRMFDPNTDPRSIEIIKEKISEYNSIQKNIESVSSSDAELPVYTAQLHKKFYEIVASLPCGYEKWMTVVTNYQQLKTMYNQRKNHKLSNDWGPFCEMIEGLPRFKEMILDAGGEAA